MAHRIKHNQKHYQSYIPRAMLMITQGLNANAPAKSDCWGTCLFHQIYRELHHWRMVVHRNAPGLVTHRF